MIITSNPGNSFERSKGDLGFSTNASEYQGNSAKIVEYRRRSGVPTFLFRFRNIQELEAYQGLNRIVSGHGDEIYLGNSTGSETRRGYG